jgi:hypothetical protein
LSHLLTSDVRGRAANETPASDTFNRAESARESRPVRGPPITITCECGESASLRYGERWECPSCGRRWNTAQIPADEYRGILRDLRRYRYAAIGAALAVLALYLPLVLLVNPALVFTAPVLLGVLAIILGPAWKRRVRRVIAERPRWDLHPD